nr:MULTISPECIES: anthranilate phosphoribosyltransferase [unclassified Fusibacter]
MTADESFRLCEDLVCGKFDNEEIKSILIMLHDHGETAANLIGFSRAMKELSPVKQVRDLPLLDVCGTGGDGLSTFNISTLTSLVTSCLGLPTAKHGNRSVTGKCGSFDIIDKLEIPYGLPDDQTHSRLVRNHLMLIYAPYAHPLMKQIMPIRKSIPHPTIFNLIGPLVNPQALTYQVLGVYKSSLLKPMAQAMQAQGIKNGYVVHGFGGLDELSLEGPNTLLHVTADAIARRVIDPKEYELTPFTNASLAIRDKSHALEAAELVLRSKEVNPYSEAVIFNASFALFTCNYRTDLNECIKIVRQLLKTNRLDDHVQELRRTNSVS